LEAAGAATFRFTFRRGLRGIRSRWFVTVVVPSNLNAFTLGILSGGAITYEACRNVSRLDPGNYARLCSDILTCKLSESSKSDVLNRMEQYKSNQRVYNVPATSQLFNLRRVTRIRAGFVRRRWIHLFMCSATWAALRDSLLYKLTHPSEDGFTWNVIMQLLKTHVSLTTLWHFNISFHVVQVFNTRLAARCSKTRYLLWYLSRSLFV
jgi:hypothetical protein